MPPVLVAGIANVSVVAGSAFAVSKIQESAANKQRKKETAQADSFAQQAQKLNEEQEEKNKILFAEDKALAEKQLILGTQRSRIETLASLQALKAQNQPVVIAPAPHPLQQFSFFDNINAKLSGFFRGLF